MVRTRGNTPQAQVATVAPGAQMRAMRTRSQSTEPSTSASTVSQTARARTARLGGTLPRAGNLPIVEEQNASDAENEPAQTTTVPLQSGLSSNNNPRVSISGTTARSTVSSEDEEAGSGPDRLTLELAPDLYDAATKLIEVLTIPNTRTKTTTTKDILRELDNHASITAKKLFSREQSFSKTLEHFRDRDGDTFLDAHKTVQAIFQPHSPPAVDSKSWGLTELVHSANLASLGKWVANAQISDPEILDFLEDLNETCPQPFLASLMEGSTFGNSELQDETFEFALAVRAQLAVTRLIYKSAENKLDPETIVQSIRSVFYAQLTTGGYSEETLKAWNFNGIGGGATGLLPEYDQQIRETIAVIQAEATLDAIAITAGKSEYMAALVSKFSWSAFRLKALSWIHQRKQELDRKIVRLGGKHAILNTVKQEIGVEATILEPSPREFDRLEPSPRKFDSFGSTLADRSPTKPKTKRVSLDVLKQIEVFRKSHSGGGAKQQPDDAATPEVEPLTEPEVVSTAEVAAIRNNLRGPGDSQNVQQPKTQNSGIAREPMTNDPQAANPAPVAQLENFGSKSPARHRRQPAADVLLADGFTPAEDYEEAVVEPEPGPSQAHRSRATQATQMKRLSKNFQAKIRQDKENRASHPTRPPAFIDRQEEAERINFDEETEEHPPQQVTSRRPGSVSRGKRPAPVDADEDEDVSQDEGFQNDSRDIGNRSQRRPPASVASLSNGRPSQPSPPKRARIASQTTKTSDARALRGSPPGPDSQEDDIPDSTNHRQVKAMAKRNVALAKMGVAPRKRKEWTAAEERQLQSLIIDYGTSWAQLKAIDVEDENLLADRDQVALKDKARNMKLAFLKAGLALPVNFEYVRLDKRGKGQLDALGIEYDY
ncbi:hypothetical protein EG327_001361 [Venturia inaequalis]|uniref:Myb-like domain-containing protein n=1 Tax=Venturia inaequalis TaxID=5025 RepID=A0A8H3Z9D2_VENIN|nr:hypothetical protein EG327_001361 [Venturia inaequalis]